jgi:uncharacterized membrane protein YccC
MVVDVSPVFAVLVFLLTLVFAVKPVRGFGLLNLVLGLFAVIVASLTVVLSSPLPFFPYFNLLMALMGVLCLWRGLKVGSLLE